MWLHSIYPFIPIPPKVRTSIHSRLAGEHGTHYLPNGHHLLAREFLGVTRPVPKGRWAARARMEREGGVAVRYTGARAASHTPPLLLPMVTAVNSAEAGQT